MWKTEFTGGEYNDSEILFRSVVEYGTIFGQFSYVGFLIDSTGNNPIRVVKAYGRFGGSFWYKIWDVDATGSASDD